MPEKVALAETFARIDAHWEPKIVGELNGQQVKLVKFLGPFVWHHHEHEDEMFLVHRGRFQGGHHHEGGAEIARQIADQLVEPGRGDRIEPGRRLVE